MRVTEGSYYALEEADPFQNFVDPYGTGDTQGGLASFANRAIGSASQTVSSGVQSVAPQPTYEPVQFQDQGWGYSDPDTGNLWRDGLWYDPDNGSVWNDPAGTWQQPQTYNDYWSQLGQHDAGFQNLFDSQPPEGAMATAPDFNEWWRAFDRNNGLAPTGEFPQQPQSFGEMVGGAFDAVANQFNVGPAEPYSLNGPGFQTPIAQQYDPRGLAFQASQLSGSNPFLDNLGASLQETGGVFADRTQRIPGLAATFGGMFGLGGRAGELPETEQLGQIYQKDVLPNVSGNEFIRTFTPFDPDNLPYGLNRLTDALAPINFATAAIAPSTPLLGALFKGPYAKNLAAEIGIDIGARLTGEQAAGERGEAIPFFGDQPAWLRGLEGGFAGGGLAAGALKGLDAGIPKLGQYMNEPIEGLPGVTRGEFGGAKFGSEPPKLTPEAPPTLELPGAPRPMEEVPLGRTGIDRILATKEETTVRPGPMGEIAGSIPGVREARGFGNPSTTLPREVHVSNLSEQAVKADLQTSFAASRQPLIDELTDAFGGFAKGRDGMVRPRVEVPYIGPSPNPLKGTWLDIAENPRDYTLTPKQSEVIAKVEARDAANVNLVRGEYNADIGLKKPDTGGIYVPRINTNEDLVTQGVRTEAGLGSSKIAKERVWETARDRVISDPNFKPETDPRKLIAAHDGAVTRMAGTETFKAGVGGKTKMEVIDEFRPGMREARDHARAQLTSLRGRMETALGRENTIAAKGRATAAQIRQVEAKMAPLEARIAALEADGSFGAELSYLSGELRQLRLKEAALQRQFSGTKTLPGVGAKLDANDLNIRSLRSEIETVQTAVEKLASQYKNINIPDRSGYVLNTKTFRYYPAEVSRGIDKIKTESLGPLDKLSDKLESSRQTVLGADPSPITIQGQMNFWRDPISSTVGFAKMMKDIATGKGTGLAELARNEPEMVSRFVRARGRALGTIGEEFDPSKSIVAKIPKVGPKFTNAETTMFNGVQRLEYEAWKNTRAILKWANPNMADDVVDAEAANALSKSVPGLNMSERGISPARGKVERMGVTSVSFATSPALLMKDAAAAVAKIAVGQRPRGREQVALVHLLSMGATITAASTLSAALTADERGLSVEEAIKKALNPANKEFASIQLSNGWRVPIGGPFRSFAKAIAPIDRDGNLTEPDLLRWARSKEAPGLGALHDLIENKDYYGDAILNGGMAEKAARGIEYFIEQAFLPITVGEIPAGVRRGNSPSEIMQNTITQAAGTSVIPPSVTDELNDVARRWEYTNADGETVKGTDFYDLPPGARADLLAAHPELNAERIEQGSERVQRTEKRTQELIAKQQVDDAAMNAGDLSRRAWRGKLGEKKDELRIRKDEIYADAGTKPGGDPVLDGYYNAIEGNKLPDGEPDWDKVDRYVAGLPRSQQDYIDTHTGIVRIDTPDVRKFEAEKDVILKSGYWEMEDENWAKVQDIVPALEKFDSYDEWRRETEKPMIKAFTDAGVSREYAEREVAKAIQDHSVVEFMQELTKDSRMRWIQQNPDAAVYAWRWEYLTPTNDQAEYLNWLITQQGAGK